MRILSKSKLIAYRQCPKRLWLEVHRPQLREDSSATQASFDVGYQVGGIAQRLYDADGQGVLIDAQKEGFSEAFARTKELLTKNKPIFEAGFSAEGALAFADIMLPVRKGGKKCWRMVEVKSSTEIKDYHRDDTAIQALVARRSDVPLVGISLAHIDSSWVYPGGEDYQGLLKENDLTEQAYSREDEVLSWIAEAQRIVARRTEPKMTTGRQCNQPYACGFLGYCSSQEPQAQFPVTWLPRIQSKALKEMIERDGGIDMSEVDDDLLNEKQRRVKDCTLRNEVYFDSSGAGDDLAEHKLPAYFLDFETIQFAVPRWKGTRPYQQLPFQFSLHRLGRGGRLDHEAFLDISGKDPSKAFAESLIAACGARGPVFVYNAGFETSRIRELADRFPRLAKSLFAINERVVDLLPVAQNRYYHPSQHGSWSIKKVLPAVAPELRYDQLNGVQDGGMAMSAFLEAIHPDTTKHRREQIHQQLLEYCALDTYAMVKLWQFFAGRHELKL